MLKITTPHPCSNLLLFSKDLQIGNLDIDLEIAATLRLIKPVRMAFGGVHISWGEYFYSVDQVHELNVSQSIPSCRKYLLPLIHLDWREILIPNGFSFIRMVGKKNKHYQLRSRGEHPTLTKIDKNEPMLPLLYCRAVMQSIILDYSISK